MAGAGAERAAEVGIQPGAVGHDEQGQGADCAHGQLCASLEALARSVRGERTTWVEGNDARVSIEVEDRSDNRGVKTNDKRRMRPG